VCIATGAGGLCRDATGVVQHDSEAMVGRDDRLVGVGGVRALASSGGLELRGEHRRVHERHTGVDVALSRMCHVSLGVVVLWIVQLHGAQG
jgi:hypothetical protein